MLEMKKWNIIVDCFSKNKKSAEKDIQRLWESIFSDIFGFSKMLGYLESQKNLQIGSRQRVIPDIFLKKDEKEVCAVELKIESEKFKPEFENQLFSYLKQAKLKIGILIIDKIYLYYYEYSKDDSKQSRIEIPFEKDNIEGEFFIKFFNFDNFNVKSIKEYIIEKVDHQNKVEQIKQNLSKNLVLDALKKYLGEDYSDIEIEDALNTIEIDIREKKTNSVVFETKKEKHLSKLNFDKNILEAGGKKASSYIKEVFIKSGYISNTTETTLAKLNKDGKRYWANPKAEFIHKDWCLILNDNTKHILYVFKIPANSISDSQVSTRIHQGSTLLDIEIIHEEEEFVCMSSKLQYNKWFVEQFNY